MLLGFLVFSMIYCLGYCSVSQTANRTQFHADMKTTMEGLRTLCG